MHNYRAGSEQNLAYGYIIDYGKYTEGNKKKIYGRGVDADLFFKIKLAQELGLDHIILVPPKAMAGSMVEDVKKYDQNADGMVVEVSSDDTENKSSKIALRFVQLAGVVNNGRPSAGAQIEFILSDTFLSEKDNFTIFQFEIVSEPREEEGAHYQVIDDQPVRISKLALMEGQLGEIPMSKEDIEIF